MPVCDAVTVQVPAATAVNVEPLTVQTEVVLEAKLTAKPDEAVAVKLAVPPTAGAVGAEKEMVCGSKAMLKVTGTAVAAA